MTRNRLITSMLAVLLLAISGLMGCKATPEGETKRWDKNSSLVGSYSSEFPQFKTVLEGVLAEAKKDFDPAKAAGDAEKMKAANEKLGDVVSRLESYTSKAKAVRDLMNDKYVLKSSSSKVDPARDTAKAALAKAAQMLADAKPADAEALKKVVIDARGELISGARPLEKLQAAGKNKGKKKKKKKSKKRKK